MADLGGVANGPRSVNGSRRTSRVRGTRPPSAGRSKADEGDEGGGGPSQSVKQAGGGDGKASTKSELIELGGGGGPEPTAAQRDGPVEEKGATEKRKE